MSSSYGENIKITIFGQSHSKGIGVVMEGIPAGTKIDYEELYSFMSRRAPGKNEFSTKRKEADLPEFLSGVVGDTTCGTPITAVIYNTDTRSQDYSILKENPRPGHADYTAEIKYGGNQDFAGGGHFSGRLTAPLCIAGGICKQILEKNGISIISRIKSIGTIVDDEILTSSTASKDFPVVNDVIADKMKQLIIDKKNEGDSVGGVIECSIIGVPAGIGDPMFDGIENKISQIVFGIPAVKGIEFGLGFDSTKICGSENNDPYRIENGKVVTVTNNCGGILGGISNGMPINFKVAIKPTPSIAKVQNTINLTTKENTTLVVPGRHDPCIVQRAVPVVEASAAIAIYDAILSSRKD